MKSTKPTSGILRISEVFAASLSNLFAFVKRGHPAWPFITHNQLSLANPRFWQYGLLALSQGAAPLTTNTDTRVQKQPKCKGYGRFGIGHSRLATALGNFEQGTSMQKVQF